MKKLLSLLAAGGLVVSSTANIVACSQDQDYNNPEGSFQLQTSTVTMSTVQTTVTIPISNWAILVDDARPSSFTFSQPNIISATVSEESQSIVIMLLAGGIEISNNKTVTITVASQLGFSQTITVNLEVAETETEFRLDATNISIGTFTSTTINISNFAQLQSTEYHPSIFTFSEEGYATAELNHISGQIEISANSRTTNNLALTITSPSGENTVVVNIEIRLEHLDLDQAELVTQIIAGNMVDGIIDTSLEIGDNNFVVTQESILDSFNTMNGLNLSDDDVEITNLISNTGSQGSSYLISAAEGSTAISGSTAVITNQGVSPNAMMTNRDLAAVRVFPSVLAEPEAAVSTSAGQRVIASIVLQYVGVRNHIMEYIAPTILNDIPGALALITGAEIAIDRYIPNWPAFGGIFTPETVEFYFSMIAEDRVSVFDGLDGRTVNIENSLLISAASGNAEALYQVQTITYNEMNESFQSIISLDEFRRFARVSRSAPGPLGGAPVNFLDILPGSTLLYGHEPAAFFQFMRNWWHAGTNIAGSASGAIIEHRVPEDRYMLQWHNEGLFGMNIALGTFAGGFRIFG